MDPDFSVQKFESAKCFYYIYKSNENAKKLKIEFDGENEHEEITLDVLKLLYKDHKDKSPKLNMAYHFLKAQGKPCSFCNNKYRDESLMPKYVLPCYCTICEECIKTSAESLIKSMANNGFGLPSVISKGEYLKCKNHGIPFYPNRIMDMALKPMIKRYNENMVDAVIGNSNSHISLQNVIICYRCRKAKLNVEHYDIWFNKCFSVMLCPACLDSYLFFNIRYIKNLVTLKKLKGNLVKIDLYVEKIQPYIIPKKQRILPDEKFTTERKKELIFQTNKIQHQTDAVSKNKVDALRTELEIISDIDKIIHL